nr:uncharacterized PE-PGRS family protein PE_PGRS20-like [Aegilops tauschii subsp. strangulata]
MAVRRRGPGTRPAAGTRVQEGGEVDSLPKSRWSDGNNGGRGSRGEASRGGESTGRRSPESGPKGTDRGAPPLSTELMRRWRRVDEEAGEEEVGDGSSRLDPGWRRTGGGSRRAGGGGARGCKAVGTRRPEGRRGMALGAMGGKAWGVILEHPSRRMRQGHTQAAGMDNVGGDAGQQASGGA